MWKVFRQLVVTTALACFLLPGATHAEKVETLEQAKALSVRTGKPILFEFNRDDCEYCQQAARDEDSVETVKTALRRVVHFPVSVLLGDGAKMSETYHVGYYYPVFVLTDSAARVIARWTGYTGAPRFLGSFENAMLDMTTIDKRLERCQTGPTPKDAFFLANYFTDTQEYLKARDYYRLLKRLQGRELDFSFPIFRVTAEAVWNNLLPFDSLIVAADDVLAKDQINQPNFGFMAQIMANAARKTNQTDRLEKYLKAGLEATADRKDQTGIDLHRDLLADYALHALNDTAEAIRVKKMALGDQLKTDPGKAFEFGDWCFRRNINLDEAEFYVRLATNKATGDKFRASHLRLLAEICYARGNTEEAVKLANEALALDPTAVWFEKKLAEWRR